MNLLELYNLKLSEYKTNDLREKPWKLLAMLLLPEKDKYKPLKISEEEFYQEYQKQIDEKISQVVKDFNFTKEDITKYIEKTIECDNYEDNRIWYVFYEGFSALYWGIMYHKDKTPEEIYSQYFNDNDLKKEYTIEQKALANNISITKLDYLLDKILEKPSEFYQKVCENITVEERIFILKNLDNKNCTNCLNGSCRVESNEKIGINELGKPQGSNCIGWYNAELIGKSKILKISDLHKLN